MKKLYNPEGDSNTYGKLKGMDSILTATYCKRLISKLKIGESGYIFSWQTRICNGFLYIQDTEINDSFGDIRCVKVTKISEHESGLELDFTNTYYGANLRPVKSEEHLSAGIVNGNKIRWIKIAPLPMPKVVIKHSNDVR